MPLSDKLKDLTEKAQETRTDLTKKAQAAVVEHSDQIHQMVQRTEETANRRTGGRYEDKIQRAADRARGLVANLEAKPDADKPGPVESPVPPPAGPA